MNGTAHAGWVLGFLGVVLLAEYLVGGPRVVIGGATVVVALVAGMWATGQREPPS